MRKAAALGQWRRAATRTSRLWARYLTGLVPEERRYWLLVPVTGVVAGLSAVFWLHYLRWVEHTAWRHPGSLLAAASAAPLWMRVAVPLGGGVLVVLVLRFKRGPPSPHGTSGLISTLVTRGGKMALLPALRDSFLSITTVGMGASVGREGALIQTGAALGSWIGTRFRLDEKHVKLLLAAGAAGGIGAAYDAPIGATVFAMEVLLGTFSLEYFGPIIISTAIATTITRRVLGELPPYVVAGIYGQNYIDLLPDVMLGLAMGLVSLAFIRIFTALDVSFAWLKRFGPVQPLVATGALGIAGMAFPQLYGNGYDTVNLVLSPSHIAMPVILLLSLAVMKVFFTALCRAGQVHGGLLTPSLFIGAMIGTAFGTIAPHVLPWHLASPATFAMIGMAAMLAGTMQAPITAVLLIFEMSSDYSMILPLMMASIASTLVCHFFEPETLYTEPLRRRGIALPHHDAPSWLRLPTVRDFMETGAYTIGLGARFPEILDRFMRTDMDANRLYVVDDNGNYVGVISLHTIKHWYQQRDGLDMIIAADIVDTRFPFVCVNDPISQALDLMTETDAERLPVLRDAKTRRLLGRIAKRQLLAAYRDSNLTPAIRVKRAPKRLVRKKREES